MRLDEALDDGEAQTPAAARGIGLGLVEYFFQALRRDGKFTVPSTIGEEKVTNPFLRVESPELVASVRERVRDVPPDDRVALFAAVRSLKDRF